MALTDNLISYWKLDGNSNDAHGSNNSTGETAITYSAGSGVINQGAGFNGSSSFITFGNGSLGADINGASAVSVSLWMKPSARPGAGDRAVAFNTVVSNNNAGLLIGLNTTNAVEVGGRSSATDSFQSVTYIDGTGTGSLIHLVGVYDFAAKKIYIYYNGSVVVNGQAVTWSQTTFNYGGSSSIPDTLGNQNSGSFFNGVIDEVGLWNRALTADEISSLYGGGAGLAYPLTIASGATGRLMMMGIGR